MSKFDFLPLSEQEKKMNDPAVKQAMLEWHKERIEHWKQFRLRAALQRIKKWADNPEPVTMLKAENVRCERSEFHE